MAAVKHVLKRTFDSSTVKLAPLPSSTATMVKFTPGRDPLMDLRNLSDTRLPGPTQAGLEPTVSPAPTTKWTRTPPKNIGRQYAEFEEDGHEVHIDLLLWT